jgi:biopolymer transport protein ExbB
MFGALARSGGKAGMTGVANGMQEALITTQTGLTIALPGLFIALVVKGKRDEIASTLARMESLILTRLFPAEPHQP